MQNYTISENDIKNNYFHFTKIKNLKSIQEKGLVPKIGFHAQALEKTKKVFFVEGLDSLLILFDCWIHVCKVYPHILGAFNIFSKVMQYNWFPRYIINGYFKYVEYNKFHKFVAYRYFDMFLEKFILLNVDIQENIDFSYDDVDQIKSKNYKKEYLIKAGYSTLYTDLESNKMDKWNMHTYSNHGIDISKIKMCYVGESNKMKDILKFCLENTNLNIEKVCPELYAYLKSRKLFYVKK